MSYPHDEKYMTIYGALMIAMNRLEWTTEEWQVVSQAVYDFMDAILLPRLSALGDTTHMSEHKEKEMNDEELADLDYDYKTWHLKRMGESK